jgi:short-subunit dehydrogenase
MKKINDLYVVYGSQSELLKDIFLSKNSYFIRIYNNRIPEVIKNASDVNNLNDFKIVFKKKFDELKPHRLVFIGSAFLTQKNLFLNETQENIQNSLDINISQYVQLVYYLLPFMVKIKSGNFIYLSSFRSQQSCRGVSLYSACKAFGEKFFEVIGKENAIFGIYSTSIRMGYFDSRMLDLMDAEKIKKISLSIGNRRLGNKDDLTKTIQFILANNYVNGGVIELTGGISF